MNKELSRNIRLGAVVIIGIIALIAALYYIGSNQHLFGSRIRINAEFENVNGLRKGNNVRFSGINIGTVESIEIASDTSVMVVMVIDSEMQPYIKKNALASIGTDGLMGNKIVNITPATIPVSSIAEGDVLRTVKFVEMDAALRTLNNTGEHVNALAYNLRVITERLARDNSALSLLTDEEWNQNLKTAVLKFRLTGEHTATLTGDLSELIQGINAGEGTIGMLLTDTVFSSDFKHTLVNIRSVSDSMLLISGNLGSFARDLNYKDGTVGMLLTDTLFAKELDQSLENIKSGAGNFNESMQNLQQRWPFNKKKSERTE